MEGQLLLSILTSSNIPQSMKGQIKQQWRTVRDWLKLHVKIWGVKIANSNITIVMFNKPNRPLTFSPSSLYYLPPSPTPTLLNSQWLSVCPSWPGFSREETCLISRLWNTWWMGHHVTLNSKQRKHHINQLSWRLLPSCHQHPCLCIIDALT